MSIDAEIRGIKDRLTDLERNAHRSSYGATKRIKRIMENQDRTGYMVDDVNNAVDVIEADLDSIDEKLEGMYTRFDSIDEKLDQIIAAIPAAVKSITG